MSAGVVYPVSATTTGGTLNPLPDYAVENLFNEAVTGPDATLDNTVTNHDYAYASARPVPGGYPVTIVAEFGSAVDLGALYLWNAGNPNKAAALEKGVKDFSLTFWDGPGATGSQVGPVFTASAAQVAGWGAIQPEIPGQTFTFPSSYNGVQSVEFRLINNQVEDADQWVGVREIAFAEPKLPLQLRISQSGGNLDFEWNSLAGMQYDLLGSTDLSSDPASWLPYNDGVTTHEDIPATGTTTTRTGVLKDGPVRFFALREEPVPPLFSADFELDDGGFTKTDGSDWEWGPPDTNGLGGTLTTGNGDSANCWATVLGDFTVSGTGFEGYYTNPTNNAVLRSPVIDLSTVSGAELSFAEALDLDVGDTAEVYIIDDATDTEIGGAVHTAADGDTNATDWQSVGPIPLPAGAIGQQVYIEWRFSGQAAEFAGWYLDDVVVTETSP